MRQFEYSIITHSDGRSYEELNERLNFKGKEGWELVTAIKQAHCTDFYFKREKGYLVEFKPIVVNNVVTKPTT